MRLFFLFLLFSISPLVCSAQKESNIWYFGGKGGMDFNSGAPKVLNDGIISTGEGCATTSDKEGKLLFYTDGVIVWNRLHKPMQNGEGLMGHWSSSQSSIIIPVPESSNLHYVFTTDAAENQLVNGLRYSIVDMGLNNGLGDVTSKNVLLLAPATEKLTAVKHRNNREIWVVAHDWNTNAFYSYLVTANGINLSPVKSLAGEIQGGPTDMYGLDNSRGMMKISPQGNKLALVHRARNRFELYDFDNVTGIVSNPLVTRSGFANAYGVEFSPDGTKLYGSKYGYSAEIYQYNLSAGSATAILNSETHITTSIHNFVGAMQLGPDGKIYVAKQYGYPLGQEGEYLGVIHNPNGLGKNCNYIDNGFFLGGRRSKLGLPNLIQSYFKIPSYDFKIIGNCFGDQILFEAVAINNAYSLKWDFGDHGSGSLNISTSRSPHHVFSKPGDFTVQLTVFINNASEVVSKTIQIIPLPSLNLGPDLNLCNGQSIILNASQTGASYMWSDNSTESTFSVKTDGTYWVEMTVGGCKARDTIIVKYVAPPVVKLGRDTTICYGQTLTLRAGQAGLSYIWQDGSGEAEYQVSGPGSYSVEVSNNNCVVVGNINIQMEECISFIPNVITPNGDGLNDYFYIEGIKPENWTLEIYNRWGKFVYKADFYHNNWKAEGLSSGAYYYWLTSKLSLQKYKGWVEVIR